MLNMTEEEKTRIWEGDKNLKKRKSQTMTEEEKAIFCLRKKF